MISTTSTKLCGIKYLVHFMTISHAFFYYHADLVIYASLPIEGPDCVKELKTAIWNVFPEADRPDPKTLVICNIIRLPV